MLSGFTKLHLRFPLEISSRNITYRSYGQYGAPTEKFPVWSEARTLNTELDEHGFLDMWNIS